MTAVRNAISGSMAAQTNEERRRALAALLRWPLLQSSGPGGEILPLVRRHQAVLREWFARHCGWTLHVESDLARLRKTPASQMDGTRPLLDSKSQPFTKRRYVLLCLALAALEKSERQTVLRRIAEEIAARFSLEPRFGGLGLTFDVTFRDHRRDLIEVIRYLIEMNVLIRIDGDEQQYLTSQQDVLYNINLSALAALPNFRRGPSTISAGSTSDRIAAVCGETYPDSEEGCNRRLRHQLFRRLLDDPVIYYSELPEDERAYFIPQRPSIVREIEAATGLVQEARSEGVAMTDPEEEMMDVGMPEEGTDGHVTLLVAEHLANRLCANEAASIPVTDIERYIESLIPHHQAYWRRSASDPGAARLLVAEALARLQKLRLVTLDSASQTAAARPAIGRFALGTPQIESNDASLWGEGNTP
jgi:uncharacterized protein (TIGR02678 family)